MTQLAQASGRPRITLWTVSTAYFLVTIGLSQSPLLPSMQQTFQVDQFAVAWVMTAYLLALTGSLLVAGKLGDTIGHRRVFVVGTVVFLLGNLLAVVAPSLLFLVFARTVQGFGAALISGNALAIVALAYQAGGSARAIGIVTTSQFLGAAFGIGVSSIAADIGWRWAFVPQIPLALATLLGAHWLAASRPSSRRRLDWPGAILLFGTLTAFSLSLSHLHEGAETFQDGFGYHTSMQVLTALVLVAFIWVERRAAAPILDFRHFRNRVFSSATAGNYLVHMMMMAGTFLMPFLVEQGMKLGHGETALLLIVIQAMNVVSSLTSARLYERYRWPWLRALGMAAIGCALLLLGLLAGTIGFPALVAISSLLGLGMGAYLAIDNAALIGALPSQHRGVASGVLETTRQTGHTLAVTVCTTAFGFVGASTIGAAPELIRQGFGLTCLPMAAFALLAVPLALIRPAARRQAVPAVPQPVASGVTE